MTVVLTGAAGKVATAMRPYLLREGLVLRLSDLREPAEIHPGETFVPTDLTDIGATQDLLQGATAVLHFAGHPRDTDWPTLEAANITACHNVFEAARTQGLGRVVFASSNHAAGFRRTADIHDSLTAPRPDGLYGVTKVFGEALTTLFADKHGMATLALRIGHVADRPADRRRLSIWLHPEDLAQLVLIGLRHPDVRGQILPAVSGTTRPFADMSEASALGYRPRYQADDHPPPEGAPENNPVATTFQGGYVAANGFDGDMTRTLAAVALPPAKQP
jgi:uronate dehydrogenase